MHSQVVHVAYNNSISQPFPCLSNLPTQSQRNKIKTCPCSHLVLKPLKTKPIGQQKQQDHWIFWAKVQFLPAPGILSRIICLRTSSGDCEVTSYSYSEQIDYLRCKDCSQSSEKSGSLFRVAQSHQVFPGLGQAPAGPKDQLEARKFW